MRPGMALAKPLTEWSPLEAMRTRHAPFAKPLPEWSRWNVCTRHFPIDLVVAAFLLQTRPIAFYTLRRRPKRLSQGSSGAGNSV